MNKVSCITVTRDRLEYLKKSIEHFAKQTHENKEHIIVYYNTDKETEEFLLENKKYLNDNNVFFYKFVEDEGQFLGAVRNFSISKATGDWVIIWDDDDWYDEKRIEKQLEFCLEQERDACTLKSLIIFSNKFQEMKVSFERVNGWEGSLLCRKEHMPRYKNAKSGEDTPVLTKLSEKYKLCTLFDPELYVYIFHDENTSSGRHKQDIFDNSYKLDIKKTRELKKKLDWI